MKGLNIIGAGNVGITLASLWRQHDIFSVRNVLNRSLQSASAACSLIGDGHAVASLEELAPAEVWLLSVADDEIAGVADKLAASGLLNAGDIVLHCSGALPSTLLHPCQNAAALIASVHPVKTFPTAQTDEDALRGTYCCMEGDAAALEVLDDAFRQIGGKTLQIDAAHKTLYHTGTVIACNYMVALQDVALATLSDAGLARDTARELLAPLLRATLENIINMDTTQALTGPIARGDAAVVSRQYECLQAHDPDRAELYRLLGQTALKLAGQKGQADENGLQSLRHLFGN